jgi:uncharacterized surface protein with fasciclin (FAS1) repeats
VNGVIIPSLADNQFIKKDIMTSNGTVHMINTTFPVPPALTSAMGQATMDPDLSTFMAAVQGASLMFSLTVNTRTGTFLAPTNAAFAEIGFDVKKKTLNGALLTNTQFNNIVRHHIINENLTQAGLTGTKNTDLGQQLMLSNSGTTVTTASGVVATITQPAVSIGPGTPANGYVYKVNKVLLPKP